MEQKTIINEIEIPIGKLASDDNYYSAVVIYYDMNNIHVTLWENGERTLSKYMLRSDWTIIRDTLDLVLFDIQKMKLPIVKLGEEL